MSWRNRGVAGGYAVAAIAAVAMMLAAAPASIAAVQIGQTFTPDPSFCGDDTAVQSTSPNAQYAAPSSGVITSWSFQAPATNLPQPKFKVARSAGGSSFTIVGESAVMFTLTPDALNTFPVRISVRTGDLIGLYLYSGGYCRREFASGYQLHSIGGDQAPGTTFPGAAAPQQLDVSAKLEPDCDLDGLGDESEDKDLSTCPHCEGALATIVGTPASDVLGGTPGADVIVGLSGKDTLAGGGGRDLICGGAGGDTEKGGAGNDSLLGQQGADLLRGANGRDTCKGGKGRDSASKCEIEKSI